MAPGRVLVTGGAGFIGRHVTRALQERGYEVVVLDALIEQVHASKRIAQLSRDMRFVRADIRDRAAVQSSLEGVDDVIHLAAEVGVGQSMYAVERYTSVNDCGTAVLLQEIARSSVRRIVVASSMSIYGEGLYRSSDGRLHSQARRGSASGFDPADESGVPMEPVATPEWKQPSLASVYALNKYAQECMTLILAGAYGREACALRLFNVFGPGQALSNPYTGVLAIFASRILNGERPVVFEDGKQRRDFVHVTDVAQAFVHALEEPSAAGATFNIGSGRNYTISEVARMIAAAMGRPDIEPEFIGKRRTGDIRHCFADISLAIEKISYRPTLWLEDGLGDMAAWVKGQTAIDRVDQARSELEQRGLVA